MVVIFGEGGQWGRGAGEPYEVLGIFCVLIWVVVLGVCIHQHSVSCTFKICVLCASYTLIGSKTKLITFQECLDWFFKYM